MKQITRLNFKVNSTKNPTYYPHSVFEDGHLNDEQAKKRVKEHLLGYGSFAKLKYKDLVVEHYNQI